jgi:alpha-beta hydrolase superfamily lysophospholipase
MPVPVSEIEASAAAPVAALVIIHGLAEYAGRYQAIASEFAARGITTFAFDQAGHGGAAGTRTHIDRFDLFVDGASAACAKFRASHSGLPLFVWGHSLGAIVALRLVSREEFQLTGLIVSSNSLEIFRRGANPLNPFTRFASRIAPRIRISLGLDATKISQDLNVQQTYASDPLIPSTASLRLIVEFAQACEIARAEAANIRTPALIVHGEQDAIAPAKGSQVLFDSIGSADKSLKIYPGLRHEVHNETAPDRARFVEDVTAWIVARVGEPPARRETGGR